MEKSKTLYDWSKVPDKYNWATTTKSGHVQVHTVPPTMVPIAETWLSDSDASFISLPAVYRDWKESLEVRPGFMDSGEVYLHLIIDQKIEYLIPMSAVVGEVVTSTGGSFAQLAERFIDTWRTLPEYQVIKVPVLKPEPTRPSYFLYPDKFIQGTLVLNSNLFNNHFVEYFIRTIKTNH